MFNGVLFKPEIKNNSLHILIQSFRSKAYEVDFATEVRNLAEFYNDNE